MGNNQLMLSPWEKSSELYTFGTQPTAYKLGIVTYDFNKTQPLTPRSL